MKLSALIQSADPQPASRVTPVVIDSRSGTARNFEVVAGDRDPELARISDDSRNVDATSLFVATPQGLPHLQRLLAGDCAIGALLLPRAVLEDAEFLAALRARQSREANADPAQSGPSPDAPEALPPVLLCAEDAALAMGALASGLYHHPSRELQIVGVTGTNGKTTVTRMLYQIWRGLGLPAGAIGTLGAVWECDERAPAAKHRDNAAGESVAADFASGAAPLRREIQTGYTTPRSPQLQELLRRMADDGVRVVALEVSSEALALGRLAGTRFAAAGFTNLSVDHLDFHGDLENYYQAKRRLFTMTAEAHGMLCIAAATEAGERLAREFEGYERRQVLAAPFIDRLPAPTRFNQWNASLACLLAEATLPSEAGGLSPAREKIAEILAQHAGIPGRFYRIDSTANDIAGGSDLYGIVDYAHTPDALQNLLAETRALGAHTIVCVFGCGGDRDRGKRPLMGAIAARLADQLIVCDDNPRSEDPSAIRAEILAAAREIAFDPSTSSSSGEQPRIQEIGDRRAAIRDAVDRARRSPRPAVVVVAGKGHEEYQIFADRRVDFSDAQELSDAFTAAQAKTATQANPQLSGDAPRPGETNQQADGIE